MSRVEMRRSGFTTLVRLLALLGVFSTCGGRSKSSLSPAAGAGGNHGSDAQVGSSPATSNAAGGSPSSVSSATTSSGAGQGATGSGGQMASAGAGGNPEIDERMLCSGARWSSPSQVVLSHTDEGVLTFVHADGSIQSFDLTYPDRPDEEVRQSMKVTADDDLVAVASGWSSFSPVLMASVALFERSTGDQRFHTLLPGHYLSGAFQLSADGSIVAGVHRPAENVVCLDAPGPCDRVVVVEPNGDARFFDGYAAFGPRIDGHLLVTPTEPEAAEPVWLDFETEETTPLARWGDRIDTVQIGPESLRYLVRTGELVQLVTETPTSVDVLALEGLAEVLNPDSVRYQVGEQTLVYPAADGSSVWHLDLEDGSLEHTELPLPQGVTPLSCYNQGVFPDDAGALTLPVRDEASAWVVRWEGGAGPELLGVPVTDVQAIQLTAAGGTYFIRSWAPGSLFCEEQTWADSGERLPTGDALQLVRPADDILELLEPTLAGFLNADGTCFYQATDDGYFVRDVFRTEAVALPVAPGGIMRWVGPS